MVGRVSLGCLAAGWGYTTGQRGTPQRDHIVAVGIHHQDAVRLGTEGFGRFPILFTR